MSRCTVSLGLVVVSLGCAGNTDSASAPAALGPEPDATCPGVFFGAPSDNTGMEAPACVPSITGDAGTWTPPAWPTEEVAALEAWTLLDPPALLASDPYAGPPPEPPQDGVVCALEVESAADRTYRLQTHLSVEEARQAGGTVTHGGACGLCSSLADLAVYAAYPDLTDPVRQCSLEGFLGERSDTVACLVALGFTEPCADIWAYNAQNTQEACQEPCLAQLGDPYHTPDGSLNTCLQCDEDESGPIFKAVAGRTRRSSGLATALCRPCETVWRIDHAAYRQ